MHQSQPVPQYRPLSTSNLVQRSRSPYITAIRAERSTGKATRQLHHALGVDFEDRGPLGVPGSNS
eukprot:1089174-Rhodomonas_salina.4